MWANDALYPNVLYFNFVMYLKWLSSIRQFNEFWRFFFFFNERKKRYHPFILLCYLLELRIEYGKKNIKKIFLNFRIWKNKIPKYTNLFSILWGGKKKGNPKMCLLLQRQNTHCIKYPKKFVKYIWKASYFCELCAPYANKRPHNTCKHIKYLLPTSYHLTISICSGSSSFFMCARPIGWWHF